MDVAQKLKLKWGVEGDENSKFFHSMLKRKRRKMAINGLSVDGSWITNPDQVEFFQFFRSKSLHFSGGTIINPSPRIKKLTHDQAINLTSRFSISEIKEAVWACGSDRAPGPDGFSFNFIKRYWELIKGDVHSFVDKFYDNGEIPKGCNSSFITLIPKIDNPMVCKDYRPISLIGVQYKIIAKILANRLGNIIQEIIDLVQSACIKGRKIFDSP